MGQQWERATGFTHPGCEDLVGTMWYKLLDSIYLWFDPAQLFLCSYSSVSTPLWNVFSPGTIFDWRDIYVFCKFWCILRIKNKSTKQYITNKLGFNKCISYGLFLKLPVKVCCTQKWRFQLRFSIMIDITGKVLNLHQFTLHYCLSCHMSL